MKNIDSTVEKFVIKNISTYKECSKIYLEVKPKSNIKKNNVVRNDNNKNKATLFNISSSNYINDQTTITNKSTSLHFFTGFKSNKNSGSCYSSNINSNLQSNSNLTSNSISKSKLVIKSSNEFDGKNKDKDNDKDKYNQVNNDKECVKPDKKTCKDENNGKYKKFEIKSTDDLSLKNVRLEINERGKKQNTSPELKKHINIKNNINSNSNKTQSNNRNNKICKVMKNANVIINKISDLNKDFIKLKLNKSISAAVNANKLKYRSNISNSTKINCKNMHDNLGNSNNNSDVNYNKITEFNYDSNSICIEDKVDRNKDYWLNEKSNVLCRGLSHNSNIRGSSKFKLSKKINFDCQISDYELSSSSAMLKFKRIIHPNTNEKLEEVYQNNNESNFYDDKEKHQYQGQDEFSSKDKEIKKTKNRFKKDRLSIDNILKLIKDNKNVILIKEKIKKCKAANTSSGNKTHKISNNIENNSCVKDKKSTENILVNQKINTDENKLKDEFLNFDLKLKSLDISKLIKSNIKNRPKEAEDISVVSSTKKIFKKIYKHDINTINSNVNLKKSNNTLEIKNIVESDILEKMQLNLEEINKIINPKYNRNKLSFLNEFNPTNEFRNSKISKIQIIDNIINGLSDLKKLVDNEENHEEKSTIKSNLISKYSKKVKNKGFNLSILENEDNVNDCSNVFNKNIIADINKSLVFTPIKILNEDLYNLYDIENLIKDKEINCDQVSRNLRFVSKHKSSDDIFLSMFNNHNRDKDHIEKKVEKNIDRNERKIENVFKHNLLSSNESNSLLYYSKLMCDTPNKSNYNCNKKDIKLKDILSDIKYDLNYEFNNVSLNLHETIEKDNSDNNSSKSETLNENEQVIVQVINKNGAQIQTQMSKTKSTDNKKYINKASTGEYTQSYCLENQSSSNSKIVNSCSKSDLNTDKILFQNSEDVEKSLSRNTIKNINETNKFLIKGNGFSLSKLTRNNKNSMINFSSFNSPMCQNSTKFLKMKEYLNSYEHSKCAIKKFTNSKQDVILKLNLKNNSKNDQNIIDKDHQAQSQNKIQKEIKKSNKITENNQHMTKTMINSNNKKHQDNFSNMNAIINQSNNRSVEKKEHLPRHSVDKSNLNFINLPGSAYFTLFTPHNDDKNCSKMVFDNRDIKEKNISNKDKEKEINEKNKMLNKFNCSGNNQNSSSIKIKSPKLDVKGLDIKSNLDFIKNIVNSHNCDENLNPNSKHSNVNANPNSRTKMKNFSLNINSYFNKKY